MKAKKKEIRNKVDSGEFTISEQFSENKDLKLLLVNYKQEFHDLWKGAFNCYINGNWQESKSRIEECLKERPNDGPSKTIMEVIHDSHYEAPQEWQGFRELTEK